MRQIECCRKKCSSRLLSYGSLGHTLLSPTNTTQSALRLLEPVLTAVTNCRSWMVSRLPQEDRIHVSFVIERVAQDDQWVAFLD